MANQSFDSNSCEYVKLMAAVRDQGCHQSFRLLVDQWKQPIARLCYKMTFSWDEAEDLTQDIFLRLFKNRLRYKETAKFSTFIWQVTINRCRDYLKSREYQQRQNQTTLIDQPHATTVDHRWNEQAELVRTALAGLPMIYREVLVLRHYENLKFNEIANVLSVPKGTVASRMSKALKLLSEQLIVITNN